jgi:hypothetical protein
MISDSHMIRGNGISATVKAAGAELCSVKTGMGVTAAKTGVQSIISALTRSDPTRHYGEVARALSAQGPARDARLQSIVDAIGNRRGNATAAPVAGDRTALLAAIGGNSYANGHRRNRTQP